MSLLLFMPLAQASVPAPSLQGLLSKADQAFRTRAVPAQAREALRDYRVLEQSTKERDPRVLWRVSMASYFVGLRLTSEKGQKEKIFAQGRDAGLRAIELKPDCAQCQFWTAINMALYGNTVGVFKMLFSLQAIESHLKATLKLDPGYVNGGAYRLLGLIEQKVPGILGGSNSQAEQDFEKAIAIAPGEPLNYQFLASLLHDELGQKKRAIRIAKKGLGISGITPDRLESFEAQQELKKMLQAWQAD